MLDMAPLETMQLRDILKKRSLSSRSAISSSEASTTKQLPLSVTRKLHLSSEKKHAISDTLNLHGFHIKISAVFNICNGLGIHNSSALAVAGAVMLFNILNLGVFAYMKGMNTVVL